MTIHEMRETVFRHCQQAFNEGLVVGNNGNFSLRDPGSGLVAITPSGIPYSDMKAEDIVIVNPDGSVHEGKHKPSSEWQMHLEVYNQRGDVHAVVHTHSPWASAFAVAGQPVPVILTEMIYSVFGEVPVAKYALPGTRELGDTALRVMHNRGACLLANHGVLAIGATMEQAHLRAGCTEETAKVYGMATTLTVGKFISLPTPLSKKRQNEIRRVAGIPEE